MSCSRCRHSPSIHWRPCLPRPPISSHAGAESIPIINRRLSRAPSRHVVRPRTAQRHQWTERRAFVSLRSVSTHHLIEVHAAMNAGRLGDLAGLHHIWLVAGWHRARHGSTAYVMSPARKSGVAKEAGGAPKACPPRPSPLGPRPTNVVAPLCNRILRVCSRTHSLGHPKLCDDERESHSLVHSVPAGCATFVSATLQLRCRALTQSCICFRVLFPS